MACLDHQLRFTNWPLKLNIDTPSSHIWNETIFSKTHHIWSLCENSGNKPLLGPVLGLYHPRILASVIRISPWFISAMGFWPFGKGVVTQPHPGVFLGCRISEPPRHHEASKISIGGWPITKRLEVAFMLQIWCPRHEVRLRTKYEVFKQL